MSPKQIPDYQEYSASEVVDALAARLKAAETEHLAATIDLENREAEAKLDSDPMKAAQSQQAVADAKRRVGVAQIAVDNAVDWLAAAEKKADEEENAD